MVRLFAPALVLLLALSLTGCSREDTPTSPTTSPDATSTAPLDPELAAGAVMLACGWDFAHDVDLPANLAALLDKCPPGSIVQDFQREVITGDIVHYSLVLSVGPGPYDVIGLHRVVREQRPQRPIRARQSLFCVHGMGKDFVGNFMPGRKSPQLPDDLGFAVYMAQHDIDVWGIDNSYTLVPGGLDDHGFAADWGLNRCIDDIEGGIAVARLVRLFTGNGLRKMTLLGYSQGLQMGYALLDRQTLLPRGRRSVGSYIPVDWGLEFDDPDLQANECEFLSGYLDLLDEGIYGFDDDPDGFYASLGYLAQTAPDEPSPYYEDLTNLEVFLFYTAVPSVEAGSVWWAGLFDDDGWPLDFAYTTQLMATEFWIHWAPMHPPVRLWADFHTLVCEDSSWESRLGLIDMPVFSLEAAGGGGPYQVGTLDRLVSAEVTRHVVQLLGPDDAWRDFAHIDLFTADDAPQLAWQPTLAWLQSRQGRDDPDAWTVTETLDADALTRLRDVEWSSPSASQWIGQPVSARQTAPSQLPQERRSLRGRYHRF